MVHRYSEPTQLKQSQVFLPLLLVAFSPLSAWAELSHLDLKGIDALVDHPGASPVYGYAALKTELENRRFLGNYGLKNAEHGCMEGASQIRDQLVKNNDCPQDYTSEWLQRLFPSQDGVNFVANQVKSDPISHLSSELIGRLLQRISDIPGAAWTDASAMRDLERDLMHMMYREMNPASYEHWLKRLSEIAGQLTTERNTKEKKSRRASCTLDEKEALKTRVGELQGKLSEIEQILAVPSLAGTRPTVQSKGIGKEGDFRSIAEMLIGSLKESRVGANPAYPKHFPEQVLLAFFIQKKANTKSDLIELFKGMPKLIKDPNFLINSEKQSAFLLDRWKRSDYKPESLESKPKRAVAGFAQHPEMLAFAVMEERFAAKMIPPVISYGSAKHESLEGGTYPDCGETSLRNFFNIVLYDSVTGKFDVGALTRLTQAHPELKIAPSLQSFYKTHSDPSSASKQAVRDAWSETVASKQGGVNYLKPNIAPQCEINAGVDNMMALVDQMIEPSGMPDAQATVVQAVPPQKKGWFRCLPWSRSGASSKRACAPVPAPELPWSGGIRLKDAGSRSQKLDWLCQALSREGKKLSWSVEGAQDQADSIARLNAKNTGVHLRFRINEEPAFSWNFEGSHFSVRDLTSGENSWKNKVGEELAKSSLHAVPGLLPWFASSSVIDTVTRSHSIDPHLLEKLIYGLPLYNNDQRLNGFRKIVSSPPKQAKALKLLANRIRAKLPEEADLYTKRNIYAALADADNPYEGDTVYPLGKPGAVYTRVSPERLAEKYGAEAAKKMGRSWMRQMYGHPVIIGEPILNQPGEQYELGLNFDQAREACIALNPSEMQFLVRVELQLREDALVKVRRENPPDLKERLQEIYRTYPISGIYLMNKAEWDEIVSDFGFREDRYISQILPQLQKKFWSSSSSLANKKEGYYFSGYHGNIESRDIHIREGMSARCAAAG